MRPLLVLLSLTLAPLLSIADPVNVNTADADAISRELKGVGLAKAQAIIEHRVAYGAYAAPEDLLNVKGIGPAVLTDNKGNILVAD